MGTDSLNSLYNIVRGRTKSADLCWLQSVIRGQIEPVRAGLTGFESPFDLRVVPQDNADKRKMLGR